MNSAAKSRPQKNARPQRSVAVQKAAVRRQSKQGEDDRRAGRAQRRLNQRSDFRQRYLDDHLVDAEAQAKGQHQEGSTTVQRAKRQTHEGIFLCLSGGDML